MTIASTMTAESAAPQTPLPPLPVNMAARLAALGVLVAVADWLFFGATHLKPGLSLAIYATAVAGALLGCAAAERAGSRHGRWAGIATALAAVAPLVETISLLSLLVALTLLAVTALLANGMTRNGLASWAAAVGMFLVAALARLPIDLVRWRQAAMRMHRSAPRAARFLVWVMPLSLTLVFLLLFAEANPLIEQTLEAIDLIWLIEQIDVPRLVFWGAMALASWPFLKPWLPAPRPRNTPPAAKQAGDTLPAQVSVLFGPEAITRALASFNLLFALQSMMDIAYLWGGVALPDGMTYAQYAHRGAYPLVVTALLAAAFVLAAMRPGSATSRDRLIRILVYAWVAQNVLLVVSSILRLDLYVSVYSLTYWRVAAFVWMLLVACGLCLVMARIALGQSNEWLVSVNIGVAAAVLYGCTFINFAAIIANWNVDQALHAPRANRQSVDVYYLASLGPQALPASRRLLSSDYPLTKEERIHLGNCVVYWKERLTLEQGQWRSWSWRGWRLDNAAVAEAPARTDNATTESARPATGPKASRTAPR